MKFRAPTRLHRKFGDVGHPAFVNGIEQKAALFRGISAPVEKKAAIPKS
jgi:hypothetical protein